MNTFLALLKALSKLTVTVQVNTNPVTVTITVAAPDIEQPAPVQDADPLDENAVAAAAESATGAAKVRTYLWVAPLRPFRVSELARRLDVSVATVRKAARQSGAAPVGRGVWALGVAS
jgi:hypothetical protein